MELPSYHCIYLLMEVAANFMRKISINNTVKLFLSKATHTAENVENVIDVGYIINMILTLIASLLFLNSAVNRCSATMRTFVTHSQARLLLHNKFVVILGGSGERHKQTMFCQYQMLSNTKRKSFNC